MSSNVRGRRRPRSAREQGRRRRQTRKAASESVPPPPPLVDPEQWRPPVSVCFCCEEPYLQSPISAKDAIRLCPACARLENTPHKQHTEPLKMNTSKKRSPRTCFLCGRRGTRLSWCKHCDEQFCEYCLGPSEVCDLCNRLKDEAATGSWTQPSPEPSPEYRSRKRVITMPQSMSHHKSLQLYTDMAVQTSPALSSRRRHNRSPMDMEIGPSPRIGPYYNAKPPEHRSRKQLLSKRCSRIQCALVVLAALSAVFSMSVGAMFFLNSMFKDD